MADSRKIALFALLFLALATQAGFCNWSQALKVSVADRDGIPVTGASVKIVYQKADGMAGNDGLMKGATGEDGNYSVTVINTVQKELENTQITVTAGANGWAGETRTVQGESNGITKVVSFVAPFSLEKMALVVLQANGTPAIGASIYITGSEVKKTADSSGKAVIYLPESSYMSGFTLYKNEVDYFNSSTATYAADGGRELIVRFPEAGAGTESPESTLLGIKFISPDGTALSGEKVVFSFDGKIATAYTDAGGRASVELDRSGEVIASVNKNDYNYSFAFNVTADGSPKNGTAALAHLLKIDYFESQSDGTGCYVLSAKASDPRLNKPISVRMAQVMNNSTSAGEIRVALDENDMYAGRVCTGPETSVKVVASNAYETVEKTIPLSQAGASQPPVGVQPNATPTSILPKPSVETTPADVLGAALAGIVMLALVLGAAALMLGKQNAQSAGGMAKHFTSTWGMLAGSTVRPIVEYLRSIFRKKEPPAMGQGPMMPLG
ncbi:MAG: hypothetical protein NTX79_01285 [Candidatus Micrarchaeota archaeon]|nr:hypothetical protein [Candidatus Micrarchaeota archaeon]